MTNQPFLTCSVVPRICRIRSALHRSAQDMTKQPFRALALQCPGYVEPADSLHLQRSAQDMTCNSRSPLASQRSAQDMT
eukprot:1528899-Pyramimonas_sp.AAC.1